MCNTVNVLLIWVSLPILLTIAQDGISGRCVLPPYPEHGSYVVSGQPNAIPGQTFDKVRLNATCRPGFRMEGNNILLCIDGIWSENLPKCVRVCRLDKHSSVKYRCVISGNHSKEGYRDCDLYELVGTVVQPECNAPNYYRSGVLSYMHCTSNGWDYVAVCKPECGTVTAKGKEQIAGGRPADHGELPWHAGIYTKITTPYRQVCGGSLVSTTEVITAAHCFWDKQEEKLQSATQFAVAVGNLFRLWGEDGGAQQSGVHVSEIKIPDRFRGAGTYFQDDLAVVVLASPIVYQTHVRPVCMDFNKIFDRRQLQPGKIGKVAGWGLTAANGPPSPVLKVLNTPYVDIIQCIKNAPPGFKQFITSDKICAGYKDGNSTCVGDSGGGLVFPAVDRGTERYYLRGVVSTAPKSNDIDACNTVETTSYTHIIPHRSFLEENIAQFHDGVPDRSESRLSNFCILPSYPKNGRYVVNGEPNAYPGQAFASVQLDISCDPGYAAEDNVTLDCSEGWWSDDMTRCARLCKLDRNPNIQYRCVTNDEGDTRECNDEERHGTTIKPECKAPYFSRKELKHMRCVEGSWDNYPTCNPSCGKVSPESNGHLPWHVTIYNTTTSNEKKPVCGGSLIKETIVITAAICVWKDANATERGLSKYSFVGVGNTYPNFKDPRDTGVQYAFIKHFNAKLKATRRHSSEEFKLSKIDGYGLVALLTPIKFTPQVSPICLDFDVKFETKQLQQGSVGKVAISTMWSTKTMNVTYIDNVSCLETKIDLREGIPDRLCVKGVVDTFCNSSAPCRATSGTGFAMADVGRDGGERYYLRGVLPEEHTFSNALENVGFVHLRTSVESELLELPLQKENTLNFVPAHYKYAE